MAIDEVAQLTQLSSAALSERYSTSLLGVFGTPQRVLVRGAGCHVWDADGNQYLDLLGGIAVNTLGHANPLLTSVITSQLATLGHVSNFFTSPSQIALAEKLLEISAAPAGSKVFFANSGTEANEAALKLTRRNAGTDQTPRTRVIALEHAFHGRTLGALSLTYKEKYRAPFAPLPENVTWIPAGDIEALREAVDETVSAVFIEPIQGEAGVKMLSAQYLQAARDITRKAGALLVFDEVQTGMGRTGAFFASAPVIPDVMTLAKGLGGGFPIGAMIVFGEENTGRLTPGDHGTTFGGNPVACAAGLAVIHTIESQNLLKQVRENGQWLRQQLAGITGVGQVRGAGMLTAFELTEANAPALVTAALDAGFIINATDEFTIRLAPPLVITQEQLGSFLQALPQLIAAA
ncbi:MULTISPECIES: acetylornithine transaminase [Micrococcaceae]|uniref:acetylornithine transaminase n=1 Tax=Arthrobacter sp. S41 TaxID=2509721 RepID=UPI001036F004|nr:MULTISPECIES: acetylornithine transaminase [Micrococcaceae]TAP26044.1 acetylornithine transaminase [Arthrobacter sp. S41]UXN33570.1 acetylornithine transaminase [Glutamicibacter sp. M10]